MESIGGEGGPGFGAMQEPGDDQHVDQLHPGAEGEGGIGEPSPGAEDASLGQTGPMKSFRLHGDGGVRQQGAE
eukprot:6302793-Prorocentrum_lima.AAC.1